MDTVQLTAGQHAYIQRDGQKTEKFLVIYKPPVVFTCQANQTFSSKDMVVEVTYDNPTGTYTDVKPNMTVLVGSASGLDDLGIARARKTPTSTKLYVGEISDVFWNNNVWLTVIDDFGLWPRHLTTSLAGVSKMDYDIAYSDQHEKFDPVPVLGTHVCVWLDAQGEAIVPFDASDSWVIDGTIASYLWETTHGTFDNTGIADPQLQITQPGMTRVGCTLTSDDSKTTKAYRRIFAFNDANPPITKFRLHEGSGSWTRGDWQFKVTMWDEAHIDNVVDRALCILFTRDYYGNDHDDGIAPMGAQFGRENIFVMGWIEGESIQMDSLQTGAVDFLVTGPKSWFDKITGFPIGLQESTAAPAAWTDMQNLTVDKALHHLLYWQSTVIPTLDVFLTNDTRKAVELTAPGDLSLAAQIANVCEQTIHARLICDHFGTVSVELDTQILPLASRSSLPAVMTLEKDDWIGKLNIERYIINRTSRINLSGVLIIPGEEPKALFSLAPGHIGTRYGKPSTNDRLLLATQSGSNELASLILTRDNHKYDVEIDLLGHNRLVDIVRSQHKVAVNITVTDNPRGIAYSGNILIREIQFSDNEDGSFLEMSWYGESENVTANSVDGDIPFSDGTIEPPEFPPPDFPPLPPLPPPIDPTPDPSLVKNVVLLITGKGVYYTKDFDSTSPKWFAMNSGIDDITLLWTIEFTSTGRLFVQEGQNAIYTAPYLGAAWTKVVDYLEIGVLSEGLGSEGHIDAMAINRGASDEGMLLGGKLGIAFAKHYYFKLTSTGVVRAVRYNDVAPFYLLNKGYMYYGGDEWVSVVSNNSNPLLVAANRLATAKLRSFTLTNGFNYMIHGGKDGKIHFVWIDGTGAKKTTDNGATVTDLASINVYAEFANNWYQSLAADPSGTYLMAGDDAGILTKKSSDGGATWGNVTGLSGTVKAAWNMGDANHFIIAFAGQPYYTSDFGANWENKVGDLWTWTGSSPVISIKAIRSF